MVIVLNDALIAMIFNRLVDIFLIIVGLSGLAVYFIQKHDQKRAAATIVKNQIDSIELTVKGLKNSKHLDHDAVYTSKDLMNRNYWEESKYLLSKKMGVSDVRLIEDFYMQAEQIDKSRKAIICRLVTAWEHKDQTLQENFYLSIKDNTVKKDEDIRTEFCRTSIMFTPNLPVDILTHNLSNFKYLSGTTAYEKISKMSYNK